MAAARSWADLINDMVTEIAVRLPCPMDRARMDLVCQDWRPGVALARDAHPPPPRLPSLLLSPGDATGVYCYLSGRRAHSTYPGARHFGSFDGAWVFLAYGQTHGHRLLNATTGESHALPDLFKTGEEDLIHPMAILAATLSHPPDENEMECVAGAVVTYQPDDAAPRRRHIAFWRPWSLIACCDVVPDAPVGPGFEPEDVVYHGDSFHFLTRGEHVLACTPILDADGAMLANLSELFRFENEGRGYDDGFVRARYIVASRGELLMVVRLAPKPDAPTSSFKVFRMSRREMPGGAADEYFWSELDALGGRMLFVGRGCSRSYEVDRYPGFRDGIYFLDEGTFYDDEMMFRRVDQRQYPCSDIGKWSKGPPPHVDHYFPEQGPSNSSPPAWLLH
ncbi:hypothetical protein U9M48_044280 [Paspalum notatum var. saurae]|uniref:KIB1-4 beta-propeller domain-containing protein n=1 Tax=Paspalum notatum var. saurae TaxID=547442 RepID=A0AAQ3UUR1_PASNO